MAPYSLIVSEAKKASLLAYQLRLEAYNTAIDELDLNRPEA